MRAFIAFEVSKEIKTYLQSLSGSMSSKVEGVKWVKQDGMHLTLKFFGEIETARAMAFRDLLSGLGGLYGPVRASLRNIDAFPDRRRARVVVMTLEKGVDILRVIFNDIEEKLSVAGIEREGRSFTPHFTLGRKRQPGPLLEKDIPVVEKKEFELNRIVLFASRLTQEGAVYTPQWEIILGGRDG